MKTLYTTHAHVTGGRAGHGRTDDDRLAVDLSRPVSGGPGTNPEQLFAVGYAACFEGALMAVARRERITLGDTSIDSTVSLRDDEDGTFSISASLAVTIPAIEDAAAAAVLVRKAHLTCPYSKAMAGNVDVGLSVNGVWVAGPHD